MMHPTCAFCGGIEGEFYGVITLICTQCVTDAHRLLVNDAAPVTVRGRGMANPYRGRVSRGPVIVEAEYD